MKESLDSEPARYQHRQEVQVLKDLSYPGIPELYDYGEREDYSYIVQEYIPGVSLQSILMQSISQRQFFNYGLQMLMLLHYLHTQKSNPILYLDVKPEHFIIYEEKVFLVDFGLARRTTEGKVVNVCYGTKEYTAPEVLERNEATITSEVYSMGVLLRDMLEKANLDKNIRERVEKLLSGMLQRNPEDRIQTLSQVITQFAEVDYRKNDGRINLRNTIAVVGSQHRVGVTYVSTFITSCLNKQGYSASYRERENDRWVMYGLGKQDGRFDSSPRWRGAFKATPGYGPFVMAESEEEGNDIIVEDFGCYGEDTLPDDLFTILVLGARPWEVQQSLKVAKDRRFLERCIFVCSLQEKRDVENLAKELGKEVFRIPMGEDPFSPDKKQCATVLRILQEFVT
ncbi:MAG: protein kinase [Lachnospiraceae bacterium]|nr:protein kinase [Lachnospiraceae bacterium]